jgi:hypothetical protein
MTALSHRRAACLFVLLSCADLVLTCELLRHPSAGHYEANWLAHSILANFDFTGLAAFKGLTVMLVGLIVFLVARSRPVAARRLGTFACLAVGVVVLYSTALLARQASSPPRPSVKDVATLQLEQQALDLAAHRQGAFSTTLAHWRTEVAAGRRTLAEAVRDLSTSDQVERFARGVRGAFGTPGTANGECMAALVMRGAVGQLLEKGSAEARARAKQLLAAYRTEYGSALLEYVLEEFEESERLRLLEPATPVQVTAISERPLSAGGAAPRECPGHQLRRHGPAGATHLAWRGPLPRRHFGWGSNLAWKSFKPFPSSPRPRFNARGWGNPSGMQAQAQLPPRPPMFPR